jgi:hypothetical protein
MRTSRIPFALVCLLGFGLARSPSVCAAELLKVYYGLLHAHTFFSDGQGTPEEAFHSAKTAGLDFFAITPHNHSEAESKDPDRADNILIANNHALYNSNGVVSIVRKFRFQGQLKTEALQVKSVMRAAMDATSSTFVALYGQEFSTISSGNHVNVLDFNEVIETGKGHFKEMYDLLKNAPSPVIVQLNHPDVHKDLFYSGSDPSVRKEMFNDYGIDDEDYGPDFANLVRHTGKFVRLIELLSGPAMEKQRLPNFRYSANEDDYRFYLIQGYHVSPSAGQDNHYKTWGTVTDARTGVFAKSLNKADLLEGLRENRTFASEDKNLEVLFELNDTHFMGKNVNLASEAELKFKIRIKDSDEPDALYRVSLFNGEVHPENRATATKTKAADGFLASTNRIGNGDVGFNVILSSAQPRFFYVTVVQNGDDRVWTAPIWLNHPKTLEELPETITYYWSGSPSSKVFHLEGCTSVKLISASNLRSGATPPPERRQHECSLPKLPDEH